MQIEKQKTQIYIAHGGGYILYKAIDGILPNICINSGISFDMNEYIVTSIHTAIDISENGNYNIIQSIKLEEI